MAKCKKCGMVFEPIRRKQTFCPGGKCRVAYNNERKIRGYLLDPDNQAAIDGLADSHDRPGDEMLNLVLRQFLNPANVPFEESYPVEEIKEG